MAHSGGGMQVIRGNGPPCPGSCQVAVPPCLWCWPQSPLRPWSWPSPAWALALSSWLPWALCAAEWLRFGNLGGVLGVGLITYYPFKEPTGIVLVKLWSHVLLIHLMKSFCCLIKQVRFRIEQGASFFLINPIHYSKHVFLVNVENKLIH